MYASQRLALFGRSKIDSVDINEVCYLTPIPDSSHLHAVLYDFHKEAYRSIEIKNITLKQFVDLYNKAGYFLRYHNSFVVNRKMTSSYSY